MHFPDAGRPVFISRDAKLEAHENGEQGYGNDEFARHSEGGKLVTPITLYRSDRLRVRLAAFLDIGRAALRAMAPIVDLRSACRWRRHSLRRVCFLAAISAISTPPGR